MPLSKEQIATLLSIKTLQSGSYGEKLREYQQTIDNQGRLQTGVGEDDSIVTYKNDVFASTEDLNNILGGQITQEDLEQINSGMGAQNTIQALVDQGLINPPDNVSQFLNFESGSQTIDPVRIHEVLSTKIYELLPDQISRQLQIDQFVKLFGSLVPPELPPYCTNADLPDVLPPDTIILDISGECNDGFKYEDWLVRYDISFIQDAGLADDAAYLTRVKGDVNQFGFGENLANEYGEGNFNKSIQYLRDFLSEYLKDIDFAPPSEILDSRPDYEFTSQGYLEIRNMNQAVVVKKGEGNILDGDDLLYLFASHSKGNKRVVGTVMTNYGIRDGLEKEGFDFFETDVGDKNVLESILNNKAYIGAESSGHIIHTDIARIPIGDGLVTMIKFIHLLFDAKKSIDEIYPVSLKIPSKLINIDSGSENEFLKKNRLIISKVEEKLNNDGRIFIRKSGTQPLIRILIEHKSMHVLNDAEKLIKSIK